MEPVLVGGIPFFLLHILESPETSSDVIEYAIQHNFDAVLVQHFADGGEILVGAEPAVDPGVVCGVIAVGGAFEYRSEVNGTAAQFLYVRDIVDHTEYLVSWLRCEIVLPGAAKVSDGVDVVEYCVFKPVHVKALL